MVKPPSHSTLHEYLTEAGELPHDVLLGNISMFTVTDGRTRFSDVEQWFDDLNLNKKWMPVENKPVDAFRKATSDLNKRTYALSNGLEASCLCRDVTVNDNYVRRQITREVRDSRKKKLSYDEAITCTFYRAPRADSASAQRGTRRGERLHVQVRRDNLCPDEHETVDGLAQEIEENFKIYYEFLDGNKIRATVRNYLRNVLNAIELKGGVYFVHASKADELERLAEFVGRLGGASYMHSYPIVDLKRQRDHIAAAFEREATESLQKITREAKDLMQTRKSITPSMYQKMREQFDTVLANANEHISHLEVSQDLTAAAAEVALQALGELREEMLK